MASLVEGQGYAGDEGSFEALYSTYRSEVQRLASYLLRNAADAEDASQTVFLNVLRALRQGVKPADPRAWLLAITRNVCFSRRRTAASRPAEVELDPETVGSPCEDGGPSADDIVGALARLLPNQRTALILRDFRGVPRAEISSLLHLSPTGVEALLTRARASFREELEAERQPFDCAETRALVEQQLEGLITVSERHTLRAHLRHCSPCSTLARAVRSSRGKLASLLPWTTGWISRLAGAFSQAPTAVHVVGAISSTAVVASLAIPAALVHAPSTTQSASRPTPASVSAGHDASSAVPPGSMSLLPSHAPTKAGLARKAAARAQEKTGKTVRAHAHHSRTSNGAAPASSSNPSSPTAAPVAGGSVQPHAASPIVTQPFARPPTGTAPRSTSPAARPSGKAKPKPARRATRGRSTGRHSSGPPDTMPASSPPADTMPAAGNGAADGAGPGFSSGTASTPATAPTTQASNAGAGGGGGSNDSSSNASNDTSSGNNGHKHKKK